jgi:hypothetical protein
MLSNIVKLDLIGISIVILLIIIVILDKRDKIFENFKTNNQVTTKQTSNNHYQVEPFYLNGNSRNNYSDFTTIGSIPPDPMVYQCNQSTNCSTAEFNDISDKNQSVCKKCSIGFPWSVLNARSSARGRIPTYIL